MEFRLEIEIRRCLRGSYLLMVSNSNGVVRVVLRFVPKGEEKLCVGKYRGNLAAPGLNLM